MPSILPFKYILLIITSVIIAVFLIINSVKDTVKLPDILSGSFTVALITIAVKHRVHLKLLKPHNPLQILCLFLSCLLSRAPK